MILTFKQIPMNISPEPESGATGCLNGEFEKGPDSEPSVIQYHYGEINTVTDLPGREILYHRLNETGVRILGHLAYLLIRTFVL